MANKLSITDDELADAIIAARPEDKSIADFLELITTPGPKEKHVDWQRVCENIRQAKSISTISRGWRKEAHRIFIDNLVGIEKIVWNKIMQTPLDESNRVDVFEAVNAVIDRCHERLDARPKNLRYNNYTLMPDNQ